MKLLPFERVFSQFHYMWTNTKCGLFLSCPSLVLTMFLSMFLSWPISSPPQQMPGGSREGTWDTQWLILVRSFSVWWTVPCVPCHYLKFQGFNKSTWARQATGPFGSRLSINVNDSIKLLRYHESEQSTLRSWSCKRAFCEGLCTSGKRPPLFERFVLSIAVGWSQWTQRNVLQIFSLQPHTTSKPSSLFVLLPSE